MIYRGKAIRYIPYNKYILYEDEVTCGFYGISHTMYKLFKIHKFTKYFRSLEELKIYLELKGYRITQ